MAFLDTIGKKITVTGQDTVQKAKDMADTVKLTSRIGELNKNISLAHSEIGKMVAEMYNGVSMEELTEKTEQVESDAQKIILGKVVSVKVLEREISDIQEQIKMLKGVTRCPSCNEEVSIDALFCSKCGLKLEKESLISGKKCEKCGAVVPEDAEFCINCGNKLAEEKEVMYARYVDRS